MSIKENKAIVARIVELSNERKYDEARELYAVDFVNHDAGAPDIRDRDALMGMFAAWGAGFRDGTAKIEDSIAEGDQVTKRWIYTGTHTDEFMGIPPTGKAIKMTAITIYRLAAGKVVECWWNYDSMGLMQQLGVIPPLGEG